MNICPECGTENQKEYIYCKNCGAKLLNQNEDKTPEFTQNMSSEPVINSNVYNQTDIDSIDGIAVEDMRIFCANESIVSKFIRMEKNGSKVSWCMPAAILGFILGPAGSAIWFFRRKMWKTALWLLAVGILIFSGNAALGTLTYTSPDPALIENLINGLVDGSIGFAEYMSGLLEWTFGGYSPWLFLLSWLGNMMNVATGVLCGLFGNFAYKRYAVHRIQRYRMMNVDPRYYQLGLSAIGGTSGGLMILGVIGVWFMFIAAQSVSLIIG